MPIPAIIGTIATAAAPLIGSGIIANAVFGNDSPEAGQQPGFFANAWDSITGFVGNIFGRDDQPAPSPTTTMTSTTNWALIGGIMAGSAVLIILIISLTRRK